MTGISKTLLGLSVLVLAGCTSTPRIYSNDNPSVSLGDYATFGFINPLGTDRNANERSLLSTHLVRATRTELENRGYRYTETDPDMLVNFNVHAQEKIQATSTPSMGMGMGYYGYRGSMYSTWGGYDTNVSQYTEGTLNVDLIDPARKELVWEGVAVGRLSEDARENMASRVPQVVAAIFQRYPAVDPG
jgi:hypothetical protein